MYVNKKILIFLALAVWYIGFAILFAKGLSLLLETKDLNFLIFGLVLAIFLGIIKTKYIFIKACQKNIKKIKLLKRPKIWEFYTLNFFLFLAAMISLGAFLSYIANIHTYLLLFIGTIDLSLSIALFFSGFDFFKALGQFFAEG